jgi:uncharacterized protein (TIGR00369 family)
MITGLEFFEGMQSNRYPTPPICETLDFAATEFEKGRVVFSGKPKANYYNPLGTLHGGYISTLLDSAMSCAIHTTLEAGKGLTSIEIKINFVRPITEKTSVLRAEGKIISVGRQIATAEARLIDERNKLYAHGTTTCLIFLL